MENEHKPEELSEEKDNEQIEELNEELLEQINKQGYLLEKRTEQLIQKMYDPSILQTKKLNYLERNFRFKTPFEEEVEIDVLAIFKDACFVIECKKTEKDWFFGIDDNSEKETFFLYKENVFESKGHISTNTTAEPIFSALTDENDELKKINKHGEYQISQRDIDSTLRQLSKNINLLINYNKEFLEKHKIKKIIPIVVTNSKLITFEYSLNDIDTSGNLLKIKNLNVHASLICNRREILKLNINDECIMLSTIWTHLDVLKTKLLENVR